MQRQAEESQNMSDQGKSFILATSELGETERSSRALYKPENRRNP